VTRLRLAGGPNANGVVVDLRFGQQPTVMSNGIDDDLMRMLVARLEAEERPRLYWQRWIEGLPWLLVLALVGSWAWFVLAERPATSLTVFGAMVSVISGLGAYELWTRLRRRVGLRFPGHVIRTISRTELRAERASRRADLKLALVTVPAGAFVGAIAQWLLSR
jgi:hypothetical protein